MNQKIELYFTRDVTLSMVGLWHILVSEDFEREFGMGIHKQITRFNGRAVEIYRDIDEMEKVKKYISKKGFSDPIFSKESLQQFKLITDQVVNLIKKVEQGNLQAMIDNFDESIRLLKIFFPWVVFANMLPSRWRDEFFKLYPEVAEELCQRWYQARVFSEGKFEIIDTYWRNLIEILLEQNNIDKKFVRVVGFEELKAMMSGNTTIDLERLKARLRGYLFFQGDLMEDKDFAEFLRENNFQYDDLEIKIDISEAKGQVACQGGKIQGQVQAIFNADEVASFNQGNILVTTMTVPDFLPAMKKAKAIVTDEGGITCHAAIVSRELNIPCVIGTKIATRVFKDGDTIEVDAQKGIVKKI